MAPMTEANASEPLGEAPSRRTALLGSGLLLLLTAALFAFVRSTNFRGYDEWLFFSLLSRDILDFPYANRPLNLVWAWPAWRLSPGALWTFWLFHAVWIGLTGVVVFAIVRRLRPEASALAFLAGALAIVWAPSDSARICTVQMIFYAGCTLGSLLALLWFLEGFLRKRMAWALAAAGAATVSVLTLEGTLVLLAFAPLLLFLAGGRRDVRRFLLWSTAAVVFLGAAAGRAFLPQLRQPERFAYQRDILAPKTDPVRLGRRVVGQLRRHIAPLGDLAVLGREPGAAIAGAAVFGVGFALVARRSGRRALLPPRDLAVAAGTGLLLALAAYAPFVLTTRARVPVRTQFLSMPGMGVLLAAAIAGLAALLPARLRLGATGLVGAFVVALGFAQTASLQADWDGVSSLPSQGDDLREIAALLPDPEPGTLLVFLSPRGVWPLDLTFRHAVRYLYDGRVTGHSEASPPYLYSIRYATDGVHSEPLPVIRDAWQEGARVFPYSVVVVVAEDETGPLRLLESWPASLPPLPDGAVYAPRARLRSGPPPRLPVLEMR
jgi:hypothetical protein